MQRRSGTPRLTFIAIAATSLMAVMAPLAWADLTPDSAFGGGDGFVTENFSTSDMGTAVVTSDTRIYAVQEEGTDTIRVLVYTLAGDLDPSYGGGDGIAEVALATVADIELLPSGKVLLAGDTTGGSSRRAPGYGSRAPATASPTSALHASVATESSTRVSPATARRR